MKTKFKTFESVSTPYKVGDYALIKILKNNILMDNMLVKIKEIRDKELVVNFLDTEIYDPKNNYIISPNFVKCWSENKKELELIITTNKYNL